MLKIRAALAAVLAACLLIAGCGGSHPSLHGGRTHSQAFVQNAEHANLPAPSALFGAVQTLRGFDAVTVGNLPPGASVAACYANGSFANCSAVKGREPRARIVTIAVNQLATGRILDTEPGDAVPSQDAGWVKRMIHLGIYRPGVYADASEMVQVRADLAAAGLKRGQYVLWVAAWNGNPAIPAGFDAHQWKSTQTLDFDTFAVSFFKAKPRPLPVCVHHRLRRATCRADKALVAKRERAATSTDKALAGIRADLKAHGCQRPYRRLTCKRLGRTATTLGKRERWFQGHAHSLQGTL